MNRKKCSAQALLLAIALLASLLVPSGTASAASDYDSVVTLTNRARLEQNSSHGSGQADISNDWYSIFSNCNNWTSSSGSYVVNCATANAALSAAFAQGYGWAIVQRTVKYDIGLGDVALYVGDKFVTVLFNPESDVSAIFRDSYYGRELHATGSSYTYGFNIVLNNDLNHAASVVSNGQRTANFSSDFTILDDSGAFNFWSSDVYFSNFPTVYPSGYAGLQIPNEPPPAKYVGMGDSYSSGQGSRRPYMAGTEMATNKCRRSSGAYPMLLAADTSLNLGPTSFVACGGATTSVIATGGFNGEPAQMDALTSETDLVTMTIAGNDIPFDVFARECATPGLDQGCHLTGRAYLNAMTSIEANVKPRVEQLLQTLDNRLASLGSNARVLVIGYPQLLPQAWVYETGCWWLQPDELPAIRAVTGALNAAIHDKVVAKGGRFEFVSATDTTSPFIEHELCREASTSSNYFNGVVSGENEPDSFHPNEAGQREGYAQLIKDYMALHPLS